MLLQGGAVVPDSEHMSLGAGAFHMPRLSGPFEGSPEHCRVSSAAPCVIHSLLCQFFSFPAYFFLSESCSVSIFELLMAVETITAKASDGDYS